jgi:hypothetical protein
MPSSRLTCAFAASETALSTTIKGRGTRIREGVDCVHVPKHRRGDDGE